MVTNERIFAKLQELKANKATPVDSSSGKTLRDDQGIFTKILQEPFNVSANDGSFLPELKKG